MSPLPPPQTSYPTLVGLIGMSLVLHAFATSNQFLFSDMEKPWEEVAALAIAHVLPAKELKAVEKSHILFPIQMQGGKLSPTMQDLHDNKDPLTILLSTCKGKCGQAGIPKAKSLSKICHIIDGMCDHKLSNNHSEKDRFQRGVGGWGGVGGSIGSPAENWPMHQNDYFLLGGWGC